jgi:hypothetical protein
MKNKILLFIAGLVVGVTVGVLFSVAIKEVISQVKELHITLNRINQKQSHLSQRIDSIQGKLIPDAKNVTTPSQAYSKTSIPNNGRIASTQETGKSFSQKPNGTSNTMPEDTDVVVMTNQLVSVISAPLKNNDSVNRKNEETDSTLESMSDINDTKKPVYFRIEFWKSPLNYKGYKMSRGKVVLYGINPVPRATVTIEDETDYLLINQSAFRVEYTDDYKPFERVTDKTLLKKLGL